MKVKINRRQRKRWCKSKGRCLWEGKVDAAISCSPRFFTRWPTPAAARCWCSGRTSPAKHPDAGAEAMKWNARRISINNNRNSIGAKGIVLPDPTIYRLSLAEQRTYLNSRFWRPECRNSTDSVDSAANQCRIVPPLLNGRPLWTVRVVEQRHGLQQLRTEKHGGLAVTHSECESI